MKPSIAPLCALIISSTSLFCAAEEHPPFPADEARRLAADLAADRKRFASEEAESQKRYQENEAALKKSMADLKSAVRNEVRADTEKNLLLLAVEYVMQTQVAKTATSEAEKMSANNRSDRALKDAASLIAKVENDGTFSPSEAQHFFEKAAGLDKKSQPNEKRP